MKITTNKSQVAWVLAGLMVLALFPELSHAQETATVDSVGAAASMVSGKMGALFDLLEAVAAIAGIVFGLKALVQLKEHSDAPHQHKLSKPITSMVVSGCLLALPTFIIAMGDTFGLGGTDGIINVFSLSAGDGSASQASDLSGMFVAFSHSITAISKLVSIGAKLAGLLLMMKVLFMLPQVEQGREMPSKVIWTLISGVGLWAMPGMFDAITGTMGAISSTDHPNPLMSGYEAAPGGAGFDDAVKAILMFIQLLGIIAFVRGMLILKAIGENKDGVMGRALTHIFGGAAAMNIYWAITMLGKTIGASTMICGVLTGVCL